MMQFFSFVRSFRSFFRSLLLFFFSTVFLHFFQPFVLSFMSLRNGHEKEMSACVHCCSVTDVSSLSLSLPPSLLLALLAIHVTQAGKN